MINQDHAGKLYSYISGIVKNKNSHLYWINGRDLERLVDYVKNQQEHHKKHTFEQEYRRLIEESGLKIDERFFP